MNEQQLAERIARAKQLLVEVHNVPIATVNEDGSPHLSPVCMAFDSQLNAYWASHVETQHSKNIVRTGEVFFAVFDSREGHGGLFMRAHAQPLEESAQAENGYEVLKNLKEKLYGSMGNLALYTGTAGQRIYCARPLKLWLNASERNEDGIILRDKRHEISLAQLLA